MADDAPAAPKPSKLSLSKIVVGLAALVAIVALGRSGGAYLPAFATWVEGLGVWGPIVFILAYALAAVAFVPGSLLTLAAGALFGLVEGTAFVFIGATLGAAAAFLVARYLTRAPIERRLADNQRFAAIDQAVGGQGRKIVFLLRLSPIFPFNLLNYALGLTQVAFIDYLVASLGMIPGTILYVYYGKLAGDVAAVAGGVAPQHDSAYYAVLAVGLLATVAVTTVVTRIARRTLAEQTKLGQNEINK